MWKYCEAFWPSRKIATAAPPIVPKPSEMIVRMNIIMTVAVTLGATSFLIGSVPSERIASICSVTTIDPSSLAMPDALRPETIRLVSTGPSSVIMDRLTNCPVNEAAPNCSSVDADCKARTAPVKKPVSTTMGSEPTPILSACTNILPR